MFIDETNNGSFENKWRKGFGAINHSPQTKKNIKNLAQDFSPNKKEFYAILAAGDRIANSAMWLAIHQAYAKNIYKDGRKLNSSDFKEDPQGHLGSTLNMIPAYVGYMVANALSGITRGWVMEQGHAVSAIDSVNLLLGNTTKAHKDRYDLTEQGMSKFCQDFYSYKINDKGEQDSPLGSHVNPHTAGGIMEGGYLGFASLQYVHMPLADERLVAFLSDGAFEEQRGADWAPKWWRAEDSGLVCPIMIANGRRIDQRTTMDQEGGPEWFAEFLELHGFDPIIFDGRDPSAFAWCIIQQEKTLQQNVARLKTVEEYDIELPYGIAVAPKGAGFYNEGTNYAHNLPLIDNPHDNEVARDKFNQHASKLHVEEEELLWAIKQITNHGKTGRLPEKNNPIANRDIKAIAAKLKYEQVKKNRSDLSSLLKKSSMDAIDNAFVSLVRANPTLRPRVGNPDEMLSNKMNDTLEELSFRVNKAEGGLHESTLGDVVTALNEEAVAAAAFGNKGGINIVVTYEAFGSKMFGQTRQEVIFSRHKKEIGKPAKWLSVPLVMTSNSWENSKNELSHQDPSFCESMLGEMSDTSRVLFPADYNSAMATIDAIYKTHGQVWTIVAAKQPTASVFSKEESISLITNGAINIEWFGHKTSKAELALVAIGSYQLAETLQASSNLKEQDIAHIVSYIAEPGRFRKPRDKHEEQHIVSNSVLKEIMPARIKNIVVASHTRPEIMTGVLSPLLQKRNFSILGFINKGGTLNTQGMLYVNQCNCEHIVNESLKLMHKS